MKAQIVILEGADGTGKTTAVLEGRDFLRARGEDDPRMIHNDASDHKLEGSLYRHYLAQLLDAIAFRNHADITTYIDRSFLSEHIYGPLYRGKSRISARQVRRLERFCKKHGIILIGATAPLKIRKARIEERGEKFDPMQPFVSVLYSQHFNKGAWTIVDSSSATVLN